MSRQDRTDSNYTRPERTATLLSPKVAGSPIVCSMRNADTGERISRKQWKAQRAAAKAIRKLMFKQQKGSK